MAATLCDDAASVLVLGDEYSFSSASINIFLLLHHHLWRQHWKTGAFKRERESE
jgi:hypothetical protein